MSIIKKNFEKIVPETRGNDLVFQVLTDPHVPIYGNCFNAVAHVAGNDYINNVRRTSLLFNDNVFGSSVGESFDLRPVPGLICQSFAPDTTQFHRINYIDDANPIHFVGEAIIPYIYGITFEVSWNYSVFNSLDKGGVTCIGGKAVAPLEDGDPLNTAEIIELDDAPTSEDYYNFTVNIGDGTSSRWFNLGKWYTRAYYSRPF